MSIHEHSDLPDLEERDLVTAVQRGDCAAFRGIYENHRDRVYNLISYSLNDLRLIEDVFQIVFMKIYRGLPGFRFESSLATWIYRVTINECQNQNRERKARFVSFETIAGSGDEIDPGAIPETSHSQVMTGGCVSLTVMVNVQLGPPPPGAALVPRIWKILSGPPEVRMQVVFLTSPILAQS